MLISVVTPVWNGERFIKETLSSIYSQEDFLHEHIVIDSMSDDSTPDIIAHNKCSKTVHVREKDNGLYDGMNRGIMRSSGDVIGIINADDLLNPGALSAVRTALLDPSVDYVYSAVDLIDEHGKALGTMSPLSIEPAPPLFPFGQDWRFYTPFPHPSLFVRKNVYEELGKYDTKYRFSADHDFMAKLIFNRKKGVYLEKQLATFRLGGASSQETSIFEEDAQIAISYGMPWLLAVANKYKCIIGRRVRG